MEETLNIIRDKVPGICLRTTLIAGFPGETKDDVEELKSFYNNNDLIGLVFLLIRHEEGTSGYDLIDDVPAAEKQPRQKKLWKCSRK